MADKTTIITFIEGAHTTAQMAKPENIRICMTQ